MWEPSCALILRFNKNYPQNEKVKNGLLGWGTRWPGEYLAPLLERWINGFDLLEIGGAVALLLLHTRELYRLPRSPYISMAVNSLFAATFLQIMFRFVRFFRLSQSIYFFPCVRLFVLCVCVGCQNVFSPLSCHVLFSAVVSHNQNMAEGTHVKQKKKKKNMKKTKNKKKQCRFERFARQNNNIIWTAGAGDCSHLFCLVRFCCDMHTLARRIMMPHRIFANRMNKKNVMKMQTRICIYQARFDVCCFFSFDSDGFVLLICGS